MRFTSFLIDRKIMGINVAAEFEVGEYFRFAPNILKKNDYQRVRVKTSGKTYDLLKKDLVQGCVIPPIILAVTEAFGEDIKAIIDDVIRNGFSQESKDKIITAIEDAVSQGELLILDGLQRTLTIQSILESRDGEFSSGDIDNFLRQPLRVEIYLGLSKPGILYRMLTLNTGQTPMSFRHQLEILYHDYIDRKDLPDGIEVYRESDEKRARGVAKYKYSDVVDMFYAFSTGAPMPYDRQALVSELKEMNFLEDYRFRPGVDSMSLLLKYFNNLVRGVDYLSEDWAFASDRLPDVARPFGTSVQSIFSRPQCMAGFGAECKRLLDKGVIVDIDDLEQIIARLTFSEDPTTSLDQLIIILDEIAKSAKKIGDAQRYFFQFSMRSLLIPDTEEAFDLSKCWLKGQETYQLMYG